MSDKPGTNEQTISEHGENNPESDSNMMTIIVKTSKGRESFPVPSNASVKTLRELVSDRYQVEQSKICLIFSGKILKDVDTLESHS